MNLLVKRKIFVLGDSRTGTSSLHRFFLSLGLSSIHDYRKESNQVEPDDEYRNENWEQLYRFIETSGIEAYSDYPTRMYFRELSEAYPEAYFILSRRKDVETWERSMVNYFAKFNIPIDMSSLRQFHLDMNKVIRKYFKNNNHLKFIEICIDDDINSNSQLLKEFLQIESPAIMGWENKAEDYDNSLYSRRKRLYNTPDPNPIGYIERICNNSKSMLSEFGWVYLINDSNNFLYYQYGLSSWTEQDKEKALKLFSDRQKFFKARNIRYYKFIIPEKSIIYTEFMPYILQSLQVSNQRPANMLIDGEAKNVHYLEPYLKDMKSYGLIYFRGDTHTNWLGSYYVYLYIIEIINNSLSYRKINPVSISQLIPEFAAYDGDLRSQLNEEFAKDLEAMWPHVQPPYGFENTIKYTLPDSIIKAWRVPTPDYYLNCFLKRETFIFENTDRTLPRAVIFRDSTSDFHIELIAQHFSRSVFIWHDGNVYQEVIDFERPDVVLHIMAERFIHQYNFRIPVNNIPEFDPTLSDSV